jgi:hypothetical protein
MRYQETASQMWGGFFAPAEMQKRKMQNETL